MLYAEIIRALPRDVSNILWEKLDQTYVQSELDQSEVLEALEQAVSDTRQEAHYDTETSRAMAGMLLGMVPEAASKVLFS